MEYKKVFEENEALMLEGINKGKQIEQLQKEMTSVVDSYQESEEFGEALASNFIDGDSQEQQIYHQYSFVFKSFPLSD